MKEPWEVLYDELWRELRRLGDRQSDGTVSVTKADADVAWKTAQEATIYHLVDALHWNVRDAQDLVSRFANAYGKGRDDQTSRQVLQDVWMEW